jgi:hypothetical protein
MAKEKFYRAAQPVVPDTGRLLHDAGVQVNSALHSLGDQLVQNPSAAIGLRIAIVSLGLSALVWATRARRVLRTVAVRRRN